MSEFNRFNLTEGMNVSVGSLLLTEGESELIRNGETEDIGKLTKRDGTLLFGSQIISSQSILGMYEFTDSSASTNYQLAVCYDGSANNDIYKIVSTTLNGSITTASTSVILTDATNFATSGTIEVEGDLITYTGKTSNTLTGATGITHNHATAKTVRQWKISKADDTYSSGKKTRFATLVDYVFRVNGSDAMGSSADCAAWGTTNCLATLTPSLISVFNDRLFAAGHSANPDRLYASSIPALDKTITWDTSTEVIDKTGSNGFYIDINPEDNSNIKALERNGTNLLVLKERSLYVYNGSATQPEELIAIGAVSQEVVKTVHNITFFLGRSKKNLGVYAYTGGYPKLISRKIKRWVDAIDQTAISNLCAGVTADYYMLYAGNIAFTDDYFYGTRTFSDVWLVYSIPQDNWRIYDGLPASMFNHYTINSAEKLFYGNKDGKIFEFGSGETDDSGDAKTKIELEYIGKEETFDSASDLKNLQQAVVYSTNARDSKLKYRYNRGEWNNLGSLKGRVTALDAPQRSSNDRMGETLQVKITDGSSYKCILEGFMLDIDQTKKDK